MAERSGAGDRSFGSGCLNVSRGTYSGSFGDDVGLDEDMGSSWMYSKGEGSVGGSYGLECGMVEYGK